MRALAVVGLALAMTMAYQIGSAQGRPWVGAPEYIGPAAVADWRVTVDRTAHTITVRGTVENRSDAALANVVVGLAASECVEAPTTPATLQPGGKATFTITLPTETNWTASAYVLADVIAPSLYVPASVRP